MRKRVVADDGTKLVLDTRKDECLYSEYDGIELVREGGDEAKLFAHKSSKNKKYYYYVRWYGGRWYEELHYTYEILSKSDAETFLLNRLSDERFSAIPREKFELIKKHFPDLIEELE